ncbi:MAG: histidine kinase [Lacibacter sp.]
MLEDSSFLVSIGANEILKAKIGRSIETKYLNVLDAISFYKHSSKVVIVGSSVKVFDQSGGRASHQGQIGGYNLRIIPSSANIIRKGDFLYSGTVGDVLQFRNKDLSRIFEVPKINFRVSKIFLNHENDILIGNQFGLWYYRDALLFPYDSSKQIFRSRVTDINEFKQKYLCIGTRGKGLLIEKTDSLYQINEANGLCSNNIRKIFIEGNHIWLATNRGISIITIESENPFKYAIKNFSVQDGLLSNEVNDIIDYGNQVIIASSSGISFLDKYKVLMRKIHPLPFYIASISTNGKNVQTRTLKDLGYNFRNVSISFDALNYSNPGKNNYRYRLSGYDTSWIYTNDRTIQFNPVPYGNFKLEIQAKREFDSWNQAGNTFSLDMVCNPPFWSSVWFYALLSALFGFASFIFFRRRVSVLKKRQNEKESLQRKISETEQMALKSQMNPHFIFNCLNSIQQYVIESDVEGANRFITGFSKLIRQTLDFSAKDKISLEEEMSYLTNYLGLEKARMEDQFKYEVCVQCNHQLSELHVPPLLLQPYVENAIRHGVRHLKNREGVIKLTFKEKGKMLECTIEDNGIGRKLAMQLKSKNPIEYQSKGMSLTAERVELLNKARENPIQIKVEDIEDHAHEISGTRVILMFPL